MAISPESAIALSTGFIGLSGIVITALIKFKPDKSRIDISKEYILKDLCDARFHDLEKQIATLSFRINELDKKIDDMNKDIKLILRKIGE